ncbi:hypothetical protein Bca4012_093778 [Brassica carinata]
MLVMPSRSQVNNPKISGTTFNEALLSLFYPLGYNYLTNTTLKFILVSTDLDVRETKVRNALSMSIKKKAEVLKVLSMNFNMLSSTWVGC